MTTIGIIGFGSFGKFLAEELAAHCTVRVYSHSGKPSQWVSSLEEVAQADFVILAIPLEVYSKTLQQLKPLLSPQTVLVDVCSVKMAPVQIIKNILPDQPLVATHPLFGPESAKDSLQDHVLVLCPESSDPEPFQQLKTFAESLQLDVVVMSAEEHDKEMATVHGLTFFIAHALKDMDLHDQKLATPSFKKLLALAELEQHHSYDLFLTIQKGNPYTKAVRAEFLQQASDLDRRVNSSQ